MVTMMRRRSRRRAAHRPLALAAGALQYAALGWPVCPGASSSHGLDGAGLQDPGRACSCDRVGCPAPGAHPVAPTWQMQATVDQRGHRTVVGSPSGGERHTRHRAGF